MGSLTLGSYRFMLFFRMTRALALILAGLALAACDKGNDLGQPISASVLVSWTANKEIDVNTTGGGYRVYYSTGSGNSLTNGSFLDVPYVSGASAPTSTLLTLNSGIHRIDVVAYSALNPTGSARSQSIEIAVPFQ